MAGGLVGHGGQQPGVIEHRLVDRVDFVVGGSGAEEVGHNKVDGGGLAEGPRNCRYVFASLGRFFPGGGGADGA